MKNYHETFASLFQNAIYRTDSAFIFVFATDIIKPNKKLEAKPHRNNLPPFPKKKKSCKTLQ